MDPFPPRESTLSRRKKQQLLLLNSGENGARTPGNASPLRVGTPTNAPPDEPQSKKKRRNSPLNLHFAPINTPMSYRLQTLGLIWHTISIPFFIFLFLFTLYLGWVVWLVVILPYFIWWYGFDLHTPSNGKAQYRYKDWVRNLIVWEWFVGYFPIKVHKSCELEPTFTNIPYEDIAVQPDDEEDLVSENSRTLLDIIFKKLGLQKRINVIDSYSPPPSTPGTDSDSASTSDAASISSSTSLTSSTSVRKYRRVSTGPRYIFGYHPHGVISMGVMGTFATNAIRNEPFEPPVKFLKPLFHDPTGKHRLLPNIEKIFPLTLSTQFTLPFYRDYLLSLGLTSAAAKNIKSLINNGDNSVVIVVGGAQESLLNDVVASTHTVGNGYSPNRDELENKSDEDEKEKKEEKEEKEEKEREEADEKEEKEETRKKNKKSKKKQKEEREIRLVLNKRKGFVKIAIELGNVSLVPIFAFGEADIYNVNIPEKGTWGDNFQTWMKKVFSFTVPFFSARGVFIYDFGFLPYRHPINLCMGRPINIPAGALQEYKLKHPDWDADSTTTVPEPSLASKKSTSSRSNSFSNLFKLNQKTAPAKKTPKKIIPPEILDHYHKLYVDELKRVYEENKDKFGYGDVKLNIVE